MQTLQKQNDEIMYVRIYTPLGITDLLEQLSNVKSPVNPHRVHYELHIDSKEKGCRTGTIDAVYEHRLNLGFYPKSYLWLDPSVSNDVLAYLESNDIAYTIYAAIQHGDTCVVSERFVGRYIANEKRIDPWFRMMTGIR